MIGDAAAILGAAAALMLFAVFIFALAVRFTEASVDTAEAWSAEEAHSMFVTVRLYTREGRYVATVDFLPFVHPPETILWGSRTFLRGRDGAYRECFMYSAPRERLEDADATDIGPEPAPRVSAPIRDAVRTLEGHRTAPGGESDSGNVG